MTTIPNRYASFNTYAPSFEEKSNLHICRINVPTHQSGFLDQITTFRAYFAGVKKSIKGKKYDLVFASSSRLFTAYLGYSIARSRRIPLYLDIRDIFTDTMQDVLKNKLVKAGVMPVLKIIEKKVFNAATHINLISKGFEPYFRKYSKPGFSYFSHGIDPEFLNMNPSNSNDKGSKVITYAGNIGEGQGLHKIIPQAAKRLGDKYRFVVIGDGGAKRKLEEQISKLHIGNVEIHNPVGRPSLLKLYDNSDFFFIHLNDYNAFKRVLPSKVFELGAYDKPMIAGVAGYAKEFILKHIPNTILFQPGDVDALVDQLNRYEYKSFFRDRFIQEFSRANVNRDMAKSILSYLE